MKRTKPVSVVKMDLAELALQNPYLLIREINNRSFYEFLKFFWPEVSSENFKDNWHIKYICDELQVLAEGVAAEKPKPYDLIVNVPPGTTKTVICSIMFPAWCWTRWFWMRFITLSYSAVLSLESAEYSRDIIKSDRFKTVYPELAIKDDKDTKSNFRIIKMVQENPGYPARKLLGGNRYSTSVGGTLTGFHGHIIIWDDPINPQQAVSPVELENTNRWLQQTLPTRKVNKATVPIIGIMQRLHQNDPTGNTLENNPKGIRHICLPGLLEGFEKQVNPPEAKKYYKNGLLDPVRLSKVVLKGLETDLGQYSFAGQIGQHPTPAKGGMFKVDMFVTIERVPDLNAISEIVRYWDKAGTAEKLSGRTKAAYTVGVKMCRLHSGKFVIIDIKRGRWSSEQREQVIKATAEGDGNRVRVYYEQEPGSGGKESAQQTTKNLAGFSAHADLPRGDKIYRADPYSVQVNEGNVLLLNADWNREFIEEHRFFPNSTYKDQVDAAGGAFAKLTAKKQVKVLTKRKR